MKPTDVLNMAITRGLISSRRPGPGGIIASCSKQEREVLSNLRSEDLLKLRVPEYVCRVGSRRGRASLP